MSQEQFNYYQQNIKTTQCTQLKMHNFEDLTNSLIHSPHAKLKFNINEQEIYHTPHFEGRISILAITLITNENILLINNYLHSGDMDAQMTLLNAFTKYIANLKKHNNHNIIYGGDFNHIMLLDDVQLPLNQNSYTFTKKELEIIQLMSNFL